MQMNVRTIFLITIVTALLNLTVQAQEEKTFRQRVISTVGRSERQWKLVKNELVVKKEEAGFDAVFLTWLIGDDELEVIVLDFDAEDEAKQTYPSAFKSCIDCLFVDKQPLKGKVRNLGNENRLWQDPKQKLTGVVFRKSKFVAEVGGPSAGAVRRLAFYLAKEMR